MNNNQNSLPLAKALDGFLAGEPAYFCIPGHRFERGISDELTKRFGNSVFKYDLTEANGLDDLHHAEGAIKEAQELAAGLYKAKHTRFLVNGTTCGNEALILASASEGEEIIVARNSHKSVIGGIILSGAKPVWIMPRYDEEWGFYTVPGKNEVLSAIKEHPNAKAVFVVSPTYYGNAGNIRELAEVCHENDMPLFVDEAHGAHLYFSKDFPKGALQNSADAVVMSSHKTTGAMTQSSMLHIGSDRVSIQRVDKALKLVMSSSPSYVLMTSLDASRHQMAKDGALIMKKTFDLSMELRSALKKIDGIKVYKGDSEKEILNNNCDPSRVVFSAVKLGITGYDLSDILYEKYGCALEMADAKNVVAVVTAGNTNEDIKRLSDALWDISNKHERVNKKAAAPIKINIPEMAYTPRKAFFLQSEKVPLKNSKGRICAQTISPYPPGIPVIVPGEIINDEIYAFLNYCRKENINIHSDGSMNIDEIEVVIEK